MVLCIRVQQPADHPLVLSVVPPRFALKELDAAFAEGDGDLDPLLAEDQILRRRKKVRNDPKASEWLVGVLDFRAHRCVCLCASSPRRISE